MSRNFAHNNLVLSLSTTTLAEPTRPKTRMECIEETIAKLASNQLHVTTTLDELIQRITVLEARQHNPPTPPSSSSAKTFLTHAHRTHVHANSASTPRAHAATPRTLVGPAYQHKRHYREACSTTSPYLTSRAWQQHPPCALLVGEND